MVTYLMCRAIVGRMVQEVLTTICGYILYYLDFSSCICRAGVDAARSFATGCFATHRTHDLRGLSEDELRVCNAVILHVHKANLLT
jgi:hypothetical protein